MNWIQYIIPPPFSRPHHRFSGDTFRSAHALHTDTPPGPGIAGWGGVHIGLNLGFGIVPVGEKPKLQLDYVLRVLSFAIHLINFIKIQ